MQMPALMLAFHFPRREGVRHGAMASRRQGALGRYYASQRDARGRAAAIAISAARRVYVLNMPRAGASTAFTARLRLSTYRRRRSFLLTFSTPCALEAAAGHAD